MDDEQKRQAGLADFKQQVKDSPPILVSRAQLVDILNPMIAEIKKTIIDVMPIVPKRFDISVDSLIPALSKAVKDNVVIETKRVEKTQTIVQQVAIPPELIELLKLQSEAITLLKNQPPPVPPKPAPISDYKPHDQATDKLNKLSFFGFADAEGKWYILCQNARAKTQRYAAGDTDYGEAWQTRANHSYTTFSEAMNG